MIEANFHPGFDALVRKLADQAKMLADAAAETGAMARRDDPRRWRSARLVWPLFTKG